MSASHFAKPDRYKLDSYNSYNYRLPETYDSCFWLKFFGVSRWDEIVVSELQPGMASLDILDVGCATGRLLAALSKGGATHVSGLDLAPRILEVGRAKLSALGVPAELRAADVEERVPWPDDSFDVVTVTGVFHHLTRPKDALLEIARVLRKGGRLLVVEVWFLPPLRQMFNLYLRLRPSAGDYRFHSPSSVTGILADLGWKRIRSSRAGWSGFMICAERPV